MWYTQSSRLVRIEEDLRMMTNLKTNVYKYVQSPTLCHMFIPVTIQYQTYAELHDQKVAVGEKHIK